MPKAKYWWQQALREKEKQTVIKLKNKDGSFKCSVVVNTNLYPLTGSPELFTCENTEVLNSAELRRAMDRVQYKIGACYSNVAELIKEARREGLEITPYCGWLFVNAYDYPIHHCWAIYGNSVLDLSDDFTVMLSGDNGKVFEAVQGQPEETRKLVVSFAKAAQSWPNTARCAAVGTPTPFLLYVGAPCEPEEGKAIYKHLIDKYPRHECQRNLEADGFNATQRCMKEAGLMDWTNKKGGD